MPHILLRLPYGKDFVPVEEFDYEEDVDGKDRVLTLDKPWDVEPDASSVISVHRSHDHQILVNNEYSDGGIALQMYGGAIDCVIASNTATRAVATSWSPTRT